MHDHHTPDLAGGHLGHAAAQKSKSGASAAGCATRHLQRRPRRRLAVREAAARQEPALLVVAVATEPDATLDPPPRGTRTELHPPPHGDGPLRLPDRQALAMTRLQVEAELAEHALDRRFPRGPVPHDRVIKRDDVPSIVALGNEDPQDIGHDDARLVLILVLSLVHGHRPSTVAPWDPVRVSSSHNATTDHPTGRMFDTPAALPALPGQRVAANAARLTTPAC